MNQQNGLKLNQKLALGTPSVSNPSVQVSTAEQNVRPQSHTNGNGKFDQSVILRQSKNWSRAILWTIVGVTTFGIIWASIAKIEQAVPAQGKLEPQGTVKEIQAPVGGVVTEIHVEEGQHVEKGDLLLSLDPTATQAQVTSLSKIRASLIKENQFYRSQLNDSAAPTITEQELSELQIPPELASLTKSRKALIAENELYRIELNGDTRGTNLTPGQRERLRFSSAELNSRVAASRLEIGQLERQLNQNQVQLANSKSRYDVERGILNEITPLAEQGAVPRIQFLKQQQEVKTRQAEVDQLLQEQARLDLDISQARQQLENTIALSQKDLTTQIATNEKQLAEIDSQINKFIVDNQQKITEIDSQLSQAKVNLGYQELRSPVSGKVFDMKPSAPGFVTNTTEPILKIVPEDALVAKVYLTNKDIGFVREDMPVDVRIDSFPFSEFGDVKGELIWIGSDALPPDQIRPYYTFPAKVRLNQQSLQINGRKIALQSGMSVSTNIRVRDRTVLSIFTDLFVDKTDSLKNVR
jgi:HlyD family secretion protein